MILSEIDDKIYATAQARIIENPEELPREMASDFKGGMNPSFIWITGRYVQADKMNKNGHYWTYDDLKRGEASIKFTPLNAQHDWSRPVGTIVETKIVERASTALPEVQALSVLWGANFPALATKVREAHKNNQLWYSMECVAEAKQCLTCQNTYPWATASEETCEHLRSNASAPRRFINPTFLGGALVFPPELPAWPDADITELAKQLTDDYAHRVEHAFDVDVWEELMGKVTK